MKKQTQGNVKKITGKFIAAQVEEGKKKASATHLIPSDKKYPNLYIIKPVAKSKIRTIQGAAERDIQTATGVSKSGVKRLMKALGRM